MPMPPVSECAARSRFALYEIYRAIERSAYVVGCEYMATFEVVASKVAGMRLIK